MIAALQSRGKKPRFLIASLAVLLLGAGWTLYSTTLPGAEGQQGIAAPQQGFPAPHFQLDTLKNEAVALADLEGQVVLLNFWATWCGPCRQEMPAMQRIYDEYQAQGLVVLAVNTTFNDNRQAAAEFAEEYGLTFPILLDEQAQVSEQYRLMATPTTYFIGRDGVIREVVLGGPMAEALLRTRVEDLLAEVQP